MIAGCNMAAMTYLQRLLTKLRLNINHQSEVYQGWRNDSVKIQGAGQIMESSEEIRKSV